MNVRQLRCLLVVFGIPFFALGCSKSDEIAHTTPAQDAAIDKLVIANAPAKKSATERIFRRVENDRSFGRGGAAWHMHYRNGAWRDDTSPYAR